MLEVVRKADAQGLDLEMLLEPHLMLEVVRKDDAQGLDLEMLLEPHLMLRLVRKDGAQRLDGPPRFEFDRGRTEF